MLCGLEVHRRNDLGAKIKQGPLSHRDTAEIIAIVAEALHHAHLREVVHRDIKPANILLDVRRQAVRGRFRAWLSPSEQFGKGSPVGPARPLT